MYVIWETSDGGRKNDGIIARAFPQVYKNLEHYCLLESISSFKNTSANKLELWKNKQVEVFMTLFYIEQIAVSKRLLTCYVVHGQGVREMLIISHKVQGASRTFCIFRTVY